MAGQEAFSKLVGDLQVGLLDRILQDPAKQELRDAAFVKNTVTPLTEVFIRKVGRPRHTWTEKVFEMRGARKAQSG